jgi:AcrR family transcriptional regulator
MNNTLTKVRAGGQTRSAKTRAAILAAAENVFAKSGFAGARTEEIAGYAGVNKAMLYYYFKSKEHLYHAVVEDHFCEFNTQALEILNAPGSARSVLLGYVGLHFDFISKRHRYASLYQQLMMAGGKTLERLVQKYFVPRVQALDKLLERGMRTKEFRKADCHHTAVSIAALIVFYFSSSQVVSMLHQGDAYSEENLLRRKQEVFDFIRYGLFQDPEAPLP